MDSFVVSTGLFGERVFLWLYFLHEVRICAARGERDFVQVNKGVLGILFVALWIGGLSNAVIAEGKPVRSAWLTYWDGAAGIQALNETETKYDAIILFAAYFDINHQLVVPRQLMMSNEEIDQLKEKPKRYLSFVNDQEITTNQFKLKDRDVLHEVFRTETSMQAHIDEIIRLALANDCDGIEIDYERIWKDELVAERFLRFVRKLNETAMQNNLRLRVVLEPSTPFEKFVGIQGVEYIVMLYNLYGVHSEPGPKADRDFIIKTIQRMQSLAANKGVAFSAGGCLWGEDGTKRFITENQARELARNQQAKLRRDKSSQCLVFDYEVAGVRYTVWYADGKTLQYWMNTAKENGITDITIWRLGG